ncbi:uncharacterized protein LOC123526710 [Mercenaria mercenaria]|uniref:uncharacterized protein LOC123526710 n=1 Tax=Mercenaria mercenaria TaxID=6596 RepID=UPI00234EC475|nr:uncharacterized protein LOC123526710 [Mercenaria mercenaria]
MSDEVSGKKQQSVLPREGTSRGKAISSSHMSVYKSSEEESVRTKGSKVSSVYKSSEEYFEYTCDPCKTVGDHAEAQGFCTNCEEYLCSTCFRSHSRSKLSKHHVLLDKDSMPKKTVKQCDPYKSVGDSIEGVVYCKDCNEYLCDSCYKSHTRSKLSRHHIMVDTDKISEQSGRDDELSFAKIDISKIAVVDQKSKEEYNYIRDVDIKAGVDKEICYITEMTLVSNNNLVLCDRDNKSLKLFDAENNIIKDVLVLEAKPLGITTISTDRIAFVLQNKCQIPVVSVNERLSVIRAVKTNGMCVDVKHVNGMFYVSFKEPVKFQIIQLTGEIYKTIKPDSEVLKHCTFPRHIAVSPDESLIYVSDWKSNKVVCINRHGYMISMYQGELDCPSVITISSSGSVYLCNRNKHNVNLMTPDLKQSTVILGAEDGLKFPVALCFNEAKHHLYISSGSDNASFGNCMKVYGSE